MQIKTALLLGGGGLVGKAVARQLLDRGISKIIINSLHINQELHKELSQKYPHAEIIFSTGNIIFPTALKDLSIPQLEKDLANKDHLQKFLYSPLNKELVHQSFIYELINTYKPDLIVDSINIASQLSYVNLFNNSNPLLALTKYMQILFLTLQEYTDTVKFYVKVGTSGTGGMGLNIPYTHGEEQPSQQLLMKSAIAGAQTQLLYLFSRTPNMPNIIEVKPAAAIAWGDIAYGPLRKGSKALKKDQTYITIKLSEDNNEQLDLKPELSSDEIISAPYIDTGENGIFGLEEFRTITHLGQMEFVTPNEIATIITQELEGKATGHNMMSGFAQNVLGPTYEAGYLRSSTIQKLAKIVEETKTDSIAFEFLGPPRLTKLLFEAHLILKVSHEKEDIKDPHQLQVDLREYLLQNKDLLMTLLSTGIPVLLDEDLNLLRGSKVLVKSSTTEKSQLENVVQSGWVDLRKSNIEVWLERLKAFTSNKPEEELLPGNLAAYIFETEQNGNRIFR